MNTRTLLRAIRDWRERVRNADYCEVKLARLCNVSPRTLWKFSHDELRTPLRVWLTRLRIHDSKAELLGLDVQIKVVALNARYKHHTDFSRQFKRSCGVSPTEWIAAHQSVG